MYNIYIQRRISPLTRTGRQAKARSLILATADRIFLTDWLGTRPLDRGHCFFSFLNTFRSPNRNWHKLPHLPEAPYVYESVLDFKQEPPSADYNGRHFFKILFVTHFIPSSPFLQMAAIEVHRPYSSAATPAKMLIWNLTGMTRTGRTRDVARLRMSLKRDWWRMGLNQTVSK